MSTEIKLDWDKAFCKGPEANGINFFPDPNLTDNSGEQAEAAKGFCVGCPLIAPCFEGALSRREPWGVWSGVEFQDGRPRTTTRIKGRPKGSKTKNPTRLFR